MFIDQVLTDSPGAHQVLPCPPAPRQLCSAGAMPAAALLYRWGKVPTTIRSMNDYPRERFPATEKEAEFTSMVDLASEHCKVLSNLILDVWSDPSMLHIRSGWSSVALASLGLGLVIQASIVSILKVF